MYMTHNIHDKLIRACNQAVRVYMKISDCRSTYGFANSVHEHLIMRGIDYGRMILNRLAKLCMTLNQQENSSCIKLGK